MAFVEAKASSSKHKPKGKTANAPSRVKTNQAKRNRVNAELRELQAKIDAFEPPAEVTAFSQLPLSLPTLRGQSPRFPLLSISLP